MSNKILKIIALTTAILTACEWVHGLWWVPMITAGIFTITMLVLIKREKYED